MNWNEECCLHLEIKDASRDLDGMQSNRWQSKRVCWMIMKDCRAWPKYEIECVRHHSHRLSFERKIMFLMKFASFLQWFEWNWLSRVCISWHSLLQPLHVNIWEIQKRLNAHVQSRLHYKIKPFGISVFIKFIWFDSLELQLYRAIKLNYVNFGETESTYTSDCK